LRVLEGLSVPLTAARKVLNKAFPKIFWKVPRSVCFGKTSNIFHDFFSDLKNKFVETQYQTIKHST
jgi:hypothetical protein